MTPDDIEKAMMRARRAIQWATCVLAARLYFTEEADQLRSAVFAAHRVFSLRSNEIARFQKMTAASVEDLARDANAWADGSYWAKSREDVVRHVKALRI